MQPIGPMKALGSISATALVSDFSLGPGPFFEKIASPLIVTEGLGAVEPMFFNLHLQSLEVRSGQLCSSLLQLPDTQLVYVPPGMDVDFVFNGLLCRQYQNRSLTFIATFSNVLACADPEGFNWQKFLDLTFPDNPSLQAYATGAPKEIHFMLHTDIRLNKSVYKLLKKSPLQFVVFASRKIEVSDAYVFERFHDRTIQSLLGVPALSAMTSCQKQGLSVLRLRRFSVSSQFEFGLVGNVRNRETFYGIAHICLNAIIAGEWQLLPANRARLAEAVYMQFRISPEKLLSVPEPQSDLKRCFRWPALITDDGKFIDVALPKFLLALHVATRACNDNLPDLKKFIEKTPGLIGMLPALLFIYALRASDKEERAAQGNIFFIASEVKGQYAAHLTSAARDWIADLSPALRAECYSQCPTVFASDAQALAFFKEHPEQAFRMPEKLKALYRRPEKQPHATAMSAVFASKAEASITAGVAALQQEKGRDQILGSDDISLYLSEVKDAAFGGLLPAAQGRPHVQFLLNAPCHEGGKSYRLAMLPCAQVHASVAGSVEEDHKIDINLSYHAQPSELMPILMRYLDGQIKKKGFDVQLAETLFQHLNDIVSALRATPAGESKERFIERLALELRPVAVGILSETQRQDLQNLSGAFEIDEAVKQCLRNKFKASQAAFEEDLKRMESNRRDLFSELQETDFFSLPENQLKVLIPLNVGYHWTSVEIIIVKKEAVFTCDVYYYDPKYPVSSQSGAGQLPQAQYALVQAALQARLTACYPGAQVIIDNKENPYKFARQALDDDTHCGYYAILDIVNRCHGKRLDPKSYAEPRQLRENLIDNFHGWADARQRELDNLTASGVRVGALRARVAALKARAEENKGRLDRWAGAGPTVFSSFRK